MTEVINQTPNLAPQSPERVTAVTGSREAVLRQLLPYDYEYAKESGLIDLFHYDPDKGEDGLLHTLAGDLRTSMNGSMVSEGYHHEESGEQVWPSVLTSEGPRPSTRVDRSHLEDLTPKRRAKYEEFPLAPYAAQVVIGGIRKFAIHVDQKTGEKKLSPASNSMFPKEYDALATMQSVRIAYDKPETQEQILAHEGNSEDFFVKTAVPLMDGKSSMQVGLAIDGQSKKVISAFPILGKKSDRMKLTPEEVEEVIYGNLRKNMVK